MLLPWAGLLSCDYLSGKYLNLKKIVTINVSIKYFTNIIAKSKAIQKMPLKLVQKVEARQVHSTVLKLWYSRQRSILPIQHSV